MSVVWLESEAHPAVSVIPSLDFELFSTPQAKLGKKKNRIPIAAMTRNLSSGYKFNLSGSYRHFLA
jgi:hypothetical protein